MNLKLKEIVWEITSKCNKNCHYCGSNNILNSEPISDDGILRIAHSIADYNVEEVTLSGGEPSMLNNKLLLNVINILKKSGTKVKIITNGHLFTTDLSSEIPLTVDTVGLSINTTIEADSISEMIVENEDFPHFMIKDVVIITNFGTYNIFEFDNIQKFVQHEDNVWQIQLTQGKYQLPADGIKFLREKISNSDTRIVLADNLQLEHECTAGISTCGISYKGEVVGCLSERSWCNGGFKRVYGIISDTISLKNIWENEFKDIRFGSRHSCRDCFVYPEPDEIKVEDKIKPPPKIDLSNIPLLYGVKKYEDDFTPWNNQRVIAYGVTKPQTVIAYGVFGGNTSYE